MPVSERCDLVDWIIWKDAAGLKPFELATEVTEEQFLAATSCAQDVHSALAAWDRRPSRPPGESQASRIGGFIFSALSIALAI